MTRMTRTVLALCTFLALGLLHSAAFGAEIQWADSYAAAVKKAKSTGRPIMIDFYADWCGWCKKLDSDVYTEANVVKKAKDFVSVKLNTETEAEGRELARKHGINSLPTILFVNEKGQVLNRVQGFKPAPAFAEEMDKTLAVHNELPQVRSQFKKNPGSIQAAARLTQLYSQMGDAENAIATLAKVAALDPQDRTGQRAKAMRAVAEMYVGQRDIKSAVAMFQKTANVASNANDVVYSRMSAAVGLVDMLGDIKSGVRELLALLRDDRVSEKDKETAREILKKIPTPLW
ncbi:MAG: hypothetical protein OHK0029_35730 [Armatimonadaceae bacterium]